MSSYSLTEAVTFSITHARKLASKVAVDLKRVQRFYRLPDDAFIDDHEAELVVLLKSGVLGELTCGFRRNGNWIEPTLRYTAHELADDGPDDDPGRVKPRCNVVDASFHSYLKYNSEWSQLTETEREKIEAQLPFRRVAAPEPGVGGYFVDDRAYSAGGRGLSRASVRSY